MFDFFSNNPIRHRIDVITNDITADSVCFQERRAPSHEWVSDDLSTKVLRLVKGLSKRTRPKFRKQKSTEKSPRPPCEPFVYRNNWPVVLLYLLFAEGYTCNERYVKVTFDHVWRGAVRSGFPAL
jgi:hypothetical protein